MINEKLFFGKFILIFAILVAAFIACTGDGEFDPDGRIKKKYAKNQEKIAQCQALVFILGASEEQKCNANPSLNECKNYNRSEWGIFAGYCYGYPNM